MSSHWFIVANQQKVNVLTQVPFEERSDQLLPESSGSRDKLPAFISSEPAAPLRLKRIFTMEYLEAKKNELHQEAAVHFAKEISKYLEMERQQKNFETLTIVAEPRFMGKIKAELTSEVSRMVKDWILKDLQKTPQNELSKFLLPNEQENRDEMNIDIV